MGDFAAVVRRRRMTRSFTDEAVLPDLIDTAVDLATRAPSAGKSQGWHFVVLEGDRTSIFWDATLPDERRASFRWPGLLSAPVVILPFADAEAYTDRYREPDKAVTGLGAGPDAWPVPYWTVDTSMAVMTLLLSFEDVGLGALFFGVFRGEAELRSRLGVPERLQLLGAVAVGHPAPEPGPGRSAGRPRRPVSEVVHRGGW